MCGITGVYNLDGKSVDFLLLQKMTDSLSHRGPDDRGIFVEDNVGLGHRRLSVIDLSALGHQPMQDDGDNLAVVFNGEIYNFQEIRKELQLKGYKFKSKTDTEVILYGYKEWGADCVKKFNGMFAFAVFDRKSKQVFIARDRIGEKPLYYYLDNKKFIFASEIKAILQDKSIKREIESQGLVNYFTFGHSVGPDTIYKNIKKLLPGHCLILKNGRVEIKEYWALDVSGQKEDKGENFYKEEIKKIFEDSVRQKMVSDVPLGVFLSGGIDSSSVAAIMAKNSSMPLKTFSVGFNGQGSEFNELADAKIVAEYFKTDHYEIILQEIDLVDTLNQLVYYFDEPFGDAANFPVFLMSQFAKKYVTVVLTGEGGDEFFGGYRRYMVEKVRPDFLFLNFIFGNDLFKKSIDFLPKLRRAKKLINNFSIRDDLERYISWIGFFSKDMQKDLFSKALKNDPFKMYQKYFLQYKGKNWVDKVMYLDQKILLPDGYLEKVDKASMAWALETRAPILDYRLVELANSIPLKYKIKGFNGKVIFKEAMKEFLPEQILHKKKHGFAVPTNAWFKDRLRDYLFEVLFDSKTKSRGYFNYNYIEKIYKLYQTKSQYLDSQLWLLLNFELW